LSLFTPASFEEVRQTTVYSSSKLCDFEILNPICPNWLRGIITNVVDTPGSGIFQND